MRENKLDSRMKSLACSANSFSVVILTFLLLAGVEAGSPEKSNTALFIFGDSTVEAGNNNYIETSSDHKANYPPYGQNRLTDEPTGRFTDGRMIADFIAEYAGLPAIPPFLQPDASFSNGANFASGGAGILPETNRGWAIGLHTQLKHFKEVQESLTIDMGDAAKARELISEAIYLVSIGSNDYFMGYAFDPEMHKSFVIDEYVGMVISNLTYAIQELYERGARKFCFIGLGPLGCLPISRALKPNATNNEGCFEELSALALAHNNAMSGVLVSLEYILKGFKYVSPNVYDWISDRINHPTRYGFKDGVSACCGTGPYRGIYSCGGRRKIEEYRVCENPKEYVWWDSVHLSEKIHEQSAMEIWSGKGEKYNVKELFFGKDNFIIDDVVDEHDELGLDFDSVVH